MHGDYLRCATVKFDYKINKQRNSFMRLYEKAVKYQNERYNCVQVEHENTFSLTGIFARKQMKMKPNSLPDQ